MRTDYWCVPSEATLTNSVLIGLAFPLTPASYSIDDLLGAEEKGYTDYTVQ